MILFVLKAEIKAARQISAGIWVGDGMGLLSGHRDAGSCVCASVEEKGGGKYKPASLYFPVHTGKWDFFFFTLEGKHPRLFHPNSRAVPSQELLSPAMQTKQG